MKISICSNALCPMSPKCGKAVAHYRYFDLAEIEFQFHNYEYTEYGVTCDHFFPLDKPSVVIKAKKKPDGD